MPTDPKTTDKDCTSFLAALPMVAAAICSVMGVVAMFTAKSDFGFAAGVGYGSCVTGCIVGAADLLSRMLVKRWR